MTDDHDNPPANDAVELEAMRKEDSSWHPCQVSLSSTGVGLILHFGESGFEDIVVNKEEVVSRIRVRSVPLQGDDCSEINQGNHILATQQSENKSLFFDAEVEKVRRVRHSKRAHCRCTFTVKWLHQEPKETFVVSSSLIMKLGTGNITSHPTIAAYMNTMEPVMPSNISALSTHDSDPDDDMEFNEELSKLIEDLSSSANLSNNIMEDDILFAFGGRTEGERQCKTIASKVSHAQPHSNQNQMMRYTRSRSKLQTDVVVQNQPRAATFIGKELTNVKTPLAALGSFIYKRLPDLEYSTAYDIAKSFSDSADITSTAHVTVGASKGTKSCLSSVGDCSLTSNKKSLSNGGPSVPFVSKTDSIVRSLFSSNDEARKPQLVDVCSEVITKELNNENTQELVHNRPDLTCSVTERKFCQPKRRLTRSVIQKGTGTSDDNVEKKIAVGGTKIRFPANKGRFTRSKLPLVEEVENVDTQKAMEENTLVKYAESKSLKEIVTDQECYASADQNIFRPSEVSDGADLLPDKNIERTMVKETGRDKCVSNSETSCVEAKNSNNTKRLTRSAARLLLGNKTTEIKPALEDNKLFEHMHTDLSQRNVTDLVSNELPTMESNSSPLLVDHMSPSKKGTQGRNKRMAGGFTIPEKIQENVTGDWESGRGNKKSKNSLLQQERRFSPRLRNLAQTRSP